MKTFGLACAAVVSGLLAGANTEPETLLVIGGDTRGYLSPCGCTKPMTGGMMRRIAVIRMLTADRTSVVVENGGLVASTGRQAELKLETMAQALRQVRAVIALSPEDARLGPGPIAAAQRLSGERLISGSVMPSPNHTLPTSYPTETFLIGTASARANSLAQALGELPIGIPESITSLVREAQRDQMTPLLLLDGEVDDARTVAREFPKLGAIVYSSTSSPPAQPERVGSVWLLTPGERGRFVVSIVARGGRFERYAVTNLGPDVADDPASRRIYQTYLKRVTEEKLLERLPRMPSPEFAGSKACQSCHSEAYDVWSKSRHAGALTTLEKDGHDRDPDCTGCHVVGLDRLGGFISRNQTPELTDVGCESCHGPSKLHVLDPKKYKTPTSSIVSCTSCHTTDTSPNFKYEAFWEKIRHQ